MYVEKKRRERERERERERVTIIEKLLGNTRKRSNVADAPGKVVILNVFAMSSKVGILIGWLPMAVLTTESYPTVIRYAFV